MADQVGMRNPVPEWLRPENESVLDSTTEKAVKAILRLFGADDPNSQVLGLAAPMETVGTSSPVVKALEYLAKRIPNPIRAFHGSPHDFDRFSLDKIGTGEGAQAYGHGLYFAENPGVASDYQRKLSRFGHASEMPEDMATSVLLDGKVVSGKTPSNQLSPQERAALAIYWDRNQEAAIRNLQDNLKYLTPGSEAHAGDLATLKVLQSEDFTGRIQPFKGRMYEVNIHADPNDFLDWDAPLSQQSEKVRQALRKQGLSGNKWEVAAIGEDARGKIHNDRFVFDKPREAREQIKSLRRVGVEARPIKSTEWKGELTAREAYEAVAETGRSDHAAAMLKAGGIPGIKYLDQGSRNQPQFKVSYGSGEGYSKHVTREGAERELAAAKAAGKAAKLEEIGTRNYVVFDDKLIEIVKKYGILGAISAGLLTQEQAKQLAAEGYQ